MSSDIGFALFKGLTIGIGLAVLYFAISLISKLLRRIGSGFNKLGEGPVTDHKNLDGHDERQ